MAAGKPPGSCGAARLLVAVAFHEFVDPVAIQAVGQKRRDEGGQPRGEAERACAPGQEVDEAVSPGQSPVEVERHQTASC